MCMEPDHVKAYKEGYFRCFLVFIMKGKPFTDDKREGVSGISSVITRFPLASLSPQWHVTPNCLQSIKHGGRLFRFPDPLVSWGIEMVIMTTTMFYETRWALLGQKGFQGMLDKSKIC